MAKSTETVEERDPAASGWQAQKSAATRKLIIESAIKCFVELGYSNTTTTAIAERAGLSRGAMLHHFPSKIDIVKAAVDYLHGKRLRAVRRAVPRAGAVEDRVRSNLEAYWRDVRHPMFVAFFELVVAARTDRELAEILQPAQEAFDREWHRTAREVFTEWKVDDATFDVALDLSRYVIEGMAISNLMNRQDGRDEKVLDYLEDKLRELRDSKEQRS